MALSDSDILLASLLGSKAVQQAPRFAAVENEMQKHVGYPVRILPFKSQDAFAKESYALKQSEVWDSRGKNQFFPLKIKRPSDSNWFTLPYEPLISVSGKNNVVKRSIAKAKDYVGTVKEHFSQDDYSITITGSLFGTQETGTFQEAFPRDDFEKLKNYMIHPQGLQVQCDFLALFDINHLVVESFDFPFSKGEYVQGYSISALSDFSADFLLEIED